MFFIILWKFLVNLTVSNFLFSSLSLFYIKFSNLKWMISKRFFMRLRLGSRVLFIRYVFIFCVQIRMENAPDFFVNFATYTTPICFGKLEKICWFESEITIFYRRSCISISVVLHCLNVRIIYLLDQLASTIRGTKRA